VATQRERARCITTGGAPGVATGGTEAEGVEGDGGGEGGSGVLAQAASTPRIAADRSLLPLTETFIMGLLLLEALGAMLVLILIVWWTMFSGRRKGERRKDDDKR
jgi:hypothetical protein